jgi:hypothetical protein
MTSVANRARQEFTNSDRTMGDTQMKRTALLGTGLVTLALAMTGAAAPALANQHTEHGTHLRTIASLNGPRGIDVINRRTTLVTEGDGTFSLVRQRAGKPARVIKLGQLVSGEETPPAISMGRHGTIYLLTGGSPPPDARTAPSFRTGHTSAARQSVTAAPGATLFKWRPGWAAPKPIADLAAYAAAHPDPYDQENFPQDSNPFGVTALRDGTVLVSDAAANSLLRVWPHRAMKHRIKTVARLKPRLVSTPAGIPGGPPAGTPILAEAVATSVTVGRDGFWYVGELRGFPATPGTSEIWRIPAGTTNAVCKPNKPHKGVCKRYADGLTSIVDLGAGDRGIYAIELSKMSWLMMDPGTPASTIGALMLVKPKGHKHRIHEMVPNQLVMPGGVDVGRRIQVVGPIFGPGALMKVVK